VSAALLLAAGAGGDFDRAAVPAGWVSISCVQYGGLVVALLYAAVHTRQSL